MNHAKGLARGRYNLKCKDKFCISSVQMIEMGPTHDKLIKYKCMAKRRRCLRFFQPFSPFSRYPKTKTSNREINKRFLFRTHQLAPVNFKQPKAKLFHGRKEKRTFSFLSPIINFLFVARPAFFSLYHLLLNRNWMGKSFSCIYSRAKSSFHSSPLPEVEGWSSSFLFGRQ